MQIQVNAGKGITGKEALEKWAVAELTTSFARFKADLTRIEVHLSDENSDRSTADDKRCVMEARMAHHTPLAVTYSASDMNEAFHGAQTKLKHALESVLDRQKNHRDRSSIRTVEGILDTDEA